MLRVLVTIKQMTLSLYFHIPFCQSRCGYCDFVTYAGFERLIPDYLRALAKQVTLFGQQQTVHSIYFGGGTPSLVPPEVYSQLFDTIRSCFLVQTDAEVTLEANPGTVNKRSLSGYRENGFNRISFGMQSARLEELRLLERKHSLEDVIRAVNDAKSVGFLNSNLDLIFGLPGQSLEDWDVSLQAALNISPDHLSLYNLIIEEGTPLARQIQNGAIPEPDDDISADQYELSCEVLEKNGFDHYEISNWAKKDGRQDFRCLHNLQYWRLHPYLGFGCDAVGFLPASMDGHGNTGQLMVNESGINRYIRQLESAHANNNLSGFLRPVSETYEMETLMYMGFRLLEEGVDPDEFMKRFGVDILQIYGKKLDYLVSRGLIEISSGGNFRLTRNSWFTSNLVFREFADESE